MGSMYTREWTGNLGTEEGKHHEIGSERDAVIKRNDDGQPPVPCNQRKRIEKRGMTLGLINTIKRKKINCIVTRYDTQHAEKLAPGSDGR